MNIVIKSPLKGGEIQAIPSKSQAHRLLICAALADGPTQIECAFLSEDIEATADCLRALGAGIVHDGAHFSVQPIRNVNKGAVLRCRESGSTLRFLLPVAAALGADCRFLLEGRLAQRPQGPLLSVLAAHGCTVTAPEPSVLELRGQLHGGDFMLPGGVSSQFVSGLLMAAPLLPGFSSVRVSGLLQSRPYVKLTIHALRAFQITVQASEQVFEVQNSIFKTPGNCTVEGDWSNAAFWLCAGALSDRGIACKGLNLYSAQGDREIVELLRQMGARVQENGGCVSVDRGNLRGIRVNVSDIPDLVPALAAVAALAEGETQIDGAERLRLKESDRLRTVAQALTALGGSVRELENGLRITGRPDLYGGRADACGDHRIAMMAAAAAVGCRGPVTVLGAQAVNKSYPVFWQHYVQLGGQLEEI